MDEIQRQREVLAGFNSVFCGGGKKVRKGKGATELLQLSESLAFNLKRLSNSIESQGTIVYAQTQERIERAHQNSLIKMMRELDTELTLITVPDLM